MSTPLVSVLMSVFNGDVFLQESLESILNQSFRDFEFIVIDDGSTDGSWSLLDVYAQRDSRMRVYHQQNRGLVQSLNRGCELARGTYIARMDADDIALRDRLTWQVDFLRQHPEIAVLGGAVELIDRRGRSLGGYARPLSGLELKSALLTRCALIHPTVMMRKDAFVFTKGYRQAVADAEDWDLWLRMSEWFGLANLDVAVLKYRLHPHQITAHKCRQQALSGLAACAAAARRRRGEPDPLESGQTVTPAGLTALGVSEAIQQAAISREYLRAIRNMYEAGEYASACATVTEALRSQCWRFAENWIVADMRLLTARLAWRDRKFAISLVRAAQAIITRPKIIGRPLKSILYRFRLMQESFCGRQSTYDN